MIYRPLYREEDFNNYMGEEADGSDDAEMSTTASVALTRIADAIGGNVVWPLFAAASQRLLASKDWRQGEGGIRRWEAG